MGRCDSTRVFDERMITRRLLLENIKSSTSHLPRLETAQQCLLIDDAATNTIDDPETSLALCKRFITNEPLRLIRQRRVQGDEARSMRCRIPLGVHWTEIGIVDSEHKREKQGVIAAWATMHASCAPVTAPFFLRIPKTRRQSGWSQS